MIALVRNKNLWAHLYHKNTTIANWIFWGSKYGAYQSSNFKCITKHIQIMKFRTRRIKRAKQKQTKNNNSTSLFLYYKLYCFLFVQIKKKKTEFRVYKQIMLSFLVETNPHTDVH